MTELAVSLAGPRLHRAILSTLAYADIFDHPLTLEEIQRYFPYELSSERLQTLIAQSGTNIELVAGYYLLPGRSPIVQTRLRREAASRRLWGRAQPWVHAVAALPFVRMLAVTGSLAMQSIDEDADLDLFVVAAPGYLWICRAMILLLARLARLFGLRLCPNYLVTERALELPIHSLYVARELAQMVPLSGLPIYDRIRALNPWTEDLLPNAVGRPASFMHLRGLRILGLIQRFLEVLLRIIPLRIAERYEMRRKILRLEREQGLSPEAFFSADVCKGHVDRHGLRIQTQYEDRLAGMEPVEAAAVRMEVQS